QASHQLRHGGHQHRRACFDGVVSVQWLERLLFWRPSHARQGRRAIFHTAKSHHQPLVQLRGRRHLAPGEVTSSSLITSTQHFPYTAKSSFSPVRMRWACSMEVTKILPSPILPVLAALMMAWIAWSTWLSESTVSILTLGKKSTVYSLPR